MVHTLLPQTLFNISNRYQHKACGFEYQQPRTSPSLWMAVFLCHNPPSARVLIMTNKKPNMRDSKGKKTSLGPKSLILLTSPSHMQAQPPPLSPHPHLPSEVLWTVGYHCNGDGAWQYSRTINSCFSPSVLESLHQKNYLNQIGTKVLRIKWGWMRQCLFYDCRPKITQVFPSNLEWQL